MLDGQFDKFIRLRPARANQRAKLDHVLTDEFNSFCCYAKLAHLLSKIITTKILLAQRDKTIFSCQSLVDDERIFDAMGTIDKVPEAMALSSARQKYLNEFRNEKVLHNCDAENHEFFRANKLFSARSEH